MAIKIIHALWGYSNGALDVTKTCQDIVNDGNDDIRADHQTLNAINFLIENEPPTDFPIDNDPSIGSHHLGPFYFGIIFSGPGLNDGNPIVLGCAENTVLDLVPSSRKATTKPQNTLAPVSGAIAVIKATYGGANNGNDVTAICQALCNQGNTSFLVSNALFGPDPDLGSLKYFTIYYRKAGDSSIPSGKACKEGDTITR